MGESQWCNNLRTDGAVRCTTGMFAHGQITDRHVPESLDVLSMTTIARVGVSKS